MGKWADGKVISDKSWALLKEHRYFLWFPSIGLAIALVPFIAFGAATLYFYSEGSTVIAFIAAAIGLVLMSFAFTVAGAATVAAVDEEFAERRASVSFGFRRAFGRLGPLFVWSIVQTAVSMVLGFLRGNQESGGSIVREYLAAAGAIAWSVVTLFVTPFIMLKHQNAKEALTSSVVMVKEKWGTQVTGGIRIGLRLLILIIPSIILIVVGFVLMLNAGPRVFLGLILFIVGVLLALIWGLISNAIRSVFSVALFHYTTGEGGYGPFTQQEMDSVLAKR